MNRLLLGLMFFFVASMANADWITLTPYRCPTEPDGWSCSSKCEKMPRLRLEFKVDVPGKKILEVQYEDGQQKSSSITQQDRFTDCTFFDEKNWQCTTWVPTPEGMKGFGSYMKMKMTKGQFFRTFNLNMNAPAQCAK